MQINKPAYFDMFHCIAAHCPDSCCKEWEVEVDDRSAALYRNLEGALGERLRSVLKDDPDWGTVMTIENGRCPMWREDGLCRIHAELGHDALCKTCRDFPRLCHDYGTFQEFGLELSCPEAARIILTFPAAPFITEECSGGDTPDYDEEAMAILLQTRTIALDILHDPHCSIPQALISLLYYSHHVQSLLDIGDAPEFDSKSLWEEAVSIAVPGNEQALMDFFSGLDILTPEWKNRLSQQFSPNPWTEEFRNLARYFVERYWLQAVSDFDLVPRVKLAVVSCILVHLLGGDVIQTAQAYSKEIENSVENVEAILDAACTHPTLTDAHLLGLLIS